MVSFMLYQVTGRRETFKCENIEADSPHNAAKIFRETHPAFSPEEIEECKVDPNSWSCHSRCEGCERAILDTDTDYSVCEDGPYLCDACLHSKYSSEVMF